MNQPNPYAPPKPSSNEQPESDQSDPSSHSLFLLIIALSYGALTWLLAIMS